MQYMNRNHSIFKDSNNYYHDDPKNDERKEYRSYKNASIMHELQLDQMILT